MYEENILAWCYAHRNEFIDYSDVMPKFRYKDGTGKLINNKSKVLKNVYDLIYDPENLLRAQYNAQKGKGIRTEILEFNKHFLDRMQELWEMLSSETYIPGKYRTKMIFDPKERVISIAPFFPDRIVHHCIIDVIGEHWNHIFIQNTYACIKDRGIHKCVEDVHKALIKDPQGTTYCLKIDVRKFYDNIDHDILKKIFRHTISDERMLSLLDKIVDSSEGDKGLPIGNYTSQYLANLYLTYFDHFVKEDLRVKYYYRYMDDMVVLSDEKEKLHELLDKFGLWLGAELKLEIKHTWQIFPVDARGIDYVGFKQYHHSIFLRKGILLRFYRKWNKAKDKLMIESEDDFKYIYSSEYGWIIRCSEVHSNYILTKCIGSNDRQGKIEPGFAH